MNYYLDTDICITALRGKTPLLLEWVRSLKPDHIKIPAIVKAELLLGAEKSEHPAHVYPLVERFLEPFEIVPFCDRCVFVYAKIRAELEKKGQLIGANDLLIAAAVEANDGVLVTQNIDEYRRVSGLRLHTFHSRA